jgi:AcrR family transcriptional regulator
MGRRKRLEKEMILEASAQLAEERGMEHFTLSELAQKLGVKTPSLYNHLNGMDQLSEELAYYAINQLEDAVRSAAVGRSGKAALYEIADAYRLFALQHPQLYSVILKLPQYEPPVIEEGRNMMQVLYRVLEPYHLNQEELRTFARAYRSAMHGFVSLEQAGFFLSEPERKTSYERLIGMILQFLPQEEGAEK